ncbi:Dynein heavy chain domain-2 [Trinorchestia longiramus]|nr:Dynein heavy chain domain-2 [Trinorchestia longiramus]
MASEELDVEDLVGCWLQAGRDGGEELRTCWLPDAVRAIKTAATKENLSVPRRHALMYAFNNLVASKLQQVLGRSVEGVLSWLGGKGGDEWVGPRVNIYLELQDGRMVLNPELEQLVSCMEQFYNELRQCVQLYRATWEGRPPSGVPQWRRTLARRCGVSLPPHQPQQRTPDECGTSPQIHGEAEPRQVQEVLVVSVGEAQWQGFMHHTRTLLLSSLRNTEALVRQMEEEWAPVLSSELTTELNTFLQDSPDLVASAAAVRRFEQHVEHANHVPRAAKLGAFRLDYSRLKASLLNMTDSHVSVLRQKLSRDHQAVVISIRDQYQELCRRLQRRPQTTTELFAVMDVVEEARRVTVTYLHTEVKRLSKRLEVLLDVVHLREEDVQLTAEVINWPAKIRPVLDKSTEVIEHHTSVPACQSLEEYKQQFEERLAEQAAEVGQALERAQQLLVELEEPNEASMVAKYMKVRLVGLEEPSKAFMVAKYMKVRLVELEEPNEASIVAKYMKVRLVELEEPNEASMVAKYMKVRLVELEEPNEASMVAKYMKEVHKIKGRLQQVEDLIEWVNAEEALFKLPTSSYPLLATLKGTLVPYSELFTLVLTWRSYEKRWMDGDFRALDPNFIDAETGRINTVLERLKKTFTTTFKQQALEGDPKKGKINFQDPNPRNLPGPLCICGVALQQVEQFRSHLLLVTVLCNRALRPRHWLLLNHIAKMDITPNAGSRSVDITPNAGSRSVDITLNAGSRSVGITPNAGSRSVDITLNAGSSLRKMVRTDLSPVMAQLQVVSSEASKEHALELQIQQMKKAWTSISLHTKDKLSPCLSLEALKEAQMLVQRHFITTHTVANSPFVKPFAGEVREWQTTLQRVDSVLQHWVKLHGTLTFFKPVFYKDGFRFSNSQSWSHLKELESCWAAIEEQTLKAGSALAGLLDDHVSLDQVTRLLHGSPLLAAARNAYLASKRSFFPRLHLLTDEELECVLCSLNFREWLPVAGKCFPALEAVMVTVCQKHPSSAGGDDVVTKHAITSGKATNNHQEASMAAVGVQCNAGEQLFFSRPLDVPSPAGCPVAWLVQLDECISDSLRSSMRETAAGFTTDATDSTTSWPVQLLQHAPSVPLQVEWSAYRARWSENVRRALLRGPGALAELLDRVTEELAAVEELFTSQNFPEDSTMKLQRNFSVNVSGCGTAGGAQEKTNNNGTEVLRATSSIRIEVVDGVQQKSHEVKTWRLGSLQDLLMSRRQCLLAEALLQRETLKEMSKAAGSPQECHEWRAVLKLFWNNQESRMEAQLADQTFPYVWQYSGAAAAVNSVLPVPLFSSRTEDDVKQECCTDGLRLLLYRDIPGDAAAHRLNLVIPGDAAVHLLNLVFPGDAAAHLLNLVFPGDAAAHLLNLVFPGDAAAHLLNLVFPGDAAAHLLNLVFPGDAAAHRLNLVFPGDAAAHRLNLVFPGDVAVHLLNLVFPGDVAVHRLNLVFPGDAAAHRLNLVFPGDAAVHRLNLVFPGDAAVHLNLVIPGDAAVHLNLVIPGDATVHLLNLIIPSDAVVQLLTLVIPSEAAVHLNLVIPCDATVHLLHSSTARNLYKSIGKLK